MLRNESVKHAFEVWLALENEAERATAEFCDATELGSGQTLTDLFERAKHLRRRASALHDELLAALDAIDSKSSTEL